MIQDIYPSRLVNAYENLSPSEGSALLFFDEEGRLASRAENGGLSFPAYPEAEASDFVYLFSVDEKAYFLAEGEPPAKGYEYRSVRELRDLCAGKELFAAFTAYHLWRWYADSRFCGRCGSALERGESERSLVCPDCGNVVYPRINPAVIVGITKGDSLLVTRYRKGYAHNALVAGFTEIGETLEQTVAREVMEETGVEVANIRYYKSQPWGMAQDILVGFFCDAVGDGEIRMDENELRYAQWVERGDIVLQPNSLSLTNEMMGAFRDNKA